MTILAVVVVLLVGLWWWERHSEVKAIRAAASLGDEERNDVDRDPHDDDYDDYDR